MLSRRGLVFLSWEVIARATVSAVESGFQLKESLDGAEPLMFHWFKRGEQFIGYESRMTAANENALPVYELTVRMPDGTERIERFDDQTALSERQIELAHEFAGDGWTGPHGRIH
jgi:hypothetical protein